MMLLAETFDFHLPPESIAQQAVRRGQSRLLVLPRASGSLQHTRFNQLVDFLQPGDCLVVNDTKVLPARLWAIKEETGARIEILLHRETDPGTWEGLARPCRRLKPGMSLRIGDNFFQVLTILNKGRVLIQFASAATGKRIIREHGTTPLPPYIQRDPGSDSPEDRQRYQTIFARQEGSVAAPTAGLHFSQSGLKGLQQRGITLAKVTLHVGWGTFAPLPEGDLTGLRLHPERYCIPEETAQAIVACRRAHGRVVACGTTVARTLESAAQGNKVQVRSGETDLFIQPGYHWQVVDGLLTNFHLPCSSLLMLVCALAGKEKVLAAYREAVEQHYRFYSYGDAMLII
jgi:S-adenosylmethionine:tRNA ribosyltransferase-isomerase